MPESGRDRFDQRIAARAAARPLEAAVVLLLAVSVVFAAVPGIDLAVAGLFSRGGDGFPAANDPVLRFVRFLGLAQTRVAVAVLILAFLGKLLAPERVRSIAPRVILFLATTLAVGPGIVVNAFLKEVWGRPRPVEITLFGGPLRFERAWSPFGGCDSNCSFVSGEASSSFWMLAVALVVPVGWRREAVAAALMWALLISVNRMIFGGHFLSDVVIAWAIDLVVIVACHELLLVRLGPGADDRLDLLWARWGAPVRGAIGRLFGRGAA